MSIECHHLSKAYRHKVLFKDVQARFERGVCHCITGENGTGKTTLLKIVAGLEKADSGSVDVQGSCTYSGSNPYMIRGTVWDNLVYPLTLKRQKTPVDYERIRAISLKLGLSSLEKQPAHALSSGEKQKVALGRALALNPDILLLDEPTANIDKEMIESIEQILMEYVKDSQHTLLLVSHDMHQVNRLNGQIWTLNQQGFYR